MPSLLVVDDDRSIRRIVQRCFQDSDVKIHSAASREEAAKATAALQPDVVVLDTLPDGSGLSALEEIRRLNPTVPVIFITTSGTSDMAIESMRLGAMDYLGKPLDMEKIREVIGQAIGISRSIRETGGSDESALAEAALAEATSADALIGHSPAMQEVYKAIGRVADQHVNVLIRGESGTGKERIARAIHRHSNRAAEKYLAVNCAAIPEALLESELFGHEKGAFTGAVGQRIGKFEECNGGTLFLDEVGDMPLAMQSKVLRDPGEGVPARRRKSNDQVGRVDRRGHEPRSGRHGGRRHVPRRLEFPLERLHDRPASSARAPRGRPAPGGTLRADVQCRDGQSDHGRRAGNHGTAGTVFLAGEYPGVADGPVADRLLDVGLRISHGRVGLRQRFPESQIRLRHVHQGARQHSPRIVEVLPKADRAGKIEDLGMYALAEELVHRFVGQHRTPLAWVASLPF